MYKLIYISLFFITSIHLVGQDEIGNESYPIQQPRQSGEKLTLYTDRSVYCSGENILFTTGYEKTDKLPDNWSNILYVELIRWNGHKLAGAKYSLGKTGGSGKIQIPANVLSGNYYLRAYTKWMRNFSVYDYAYIPVKVVNPYKEITDSVPHEITDPKNIDSLDLNLANNLLTCSTNKKTYGTREKVKLNIDLKSRSGQDNDVFITVVRKGNVNEKSLLISTRENMSSTEQKTLQYLPDIRGVSLSGKIVDRDSEKPLENITVHLTTPISGIYYSGFRTTLNGNFNFTFPANITGTHDFYLNAQTHDTIDAEILIDNDFCNKPVTLTHQPFELTLQEKQLVREMMLTQQINKRYRITDEDTLSGSSGNKVFYGEAQNVIYTETYIELPNMEEFFFELVPEVQVLYNKKEPYLRITKATSLAGLYQPLLLVDNIPVEENKFLDIPNSRIERVEVINDGYVAGNMKYNGLISIYSKKDDMAGIELSPNSVFFSYQLLSDAPSDFPAETIHNSRVPDRRNTLYWNPDFKLSKQKENTLTFHTSDITGEYVVYLRTKNNEGSPVYGKCSFTVK